MFVNGRMTCLRCWALHSCKTIFEDDKEDIETCRVVARCLRLGGKDALVPYEDIPRTHLQLSS